MLAATYRSKPFVLPDVRFSLHPRSPSHSQRVRLQVRDRPTGYDRIIRPFEEWYKSVSTSISRLPSSSKPVVITNRPASVRLFGPIDQRAYQQAMSIYYRPAQLTRRLRRGKHRRGHRTEMVGRLDLSIVDPIPFPPRAGGVSGYQDRQENRACHGLLPNAAYLVDGGSRPRIAFGTLIIKLLNVNPAEAGSKAVPAFFFRSSSNRPARRCARRSET
jgi:hypothetical protein